MGEFTHMMRNPIRERDDRIRELEAEVTALKEREADLVRQNVALMGQNGRLQQEVERLRAELDTVGEVLAATSLKCDYAFQRGAAAMREAAARRCEISPIHGEKTITARKYADAVRALPDLEDTE